MPETTEDAAAWYTLTGLLKTCTEFIHKAIESSPIIIILVLCGYVQSYVPKKICPYFLK